MKEVWFVTYNFIGIDGNLVQMPIKDQNKIRQFESKDAIIEYITENSSQKNVIYQIQSGLIKT